MDFDQRKISNIHDFNLDFNLMRDRLRSLKEKYPLGLIIPVLGNDIRSPTLASMIEEINHCDYLKKVFIALSATSDADYEEALSLCRLFTVPFDVVWCNKPEVCAVLEDLRVKGLDVTQQTGKGKDLWVTIGIASLELFAFAVHDADIATYSRMLPTKLLYPTVEPELDFFFCKGYYARINLENRRLYGRLQRLFIIPLLEVLQEITGYSKFITFLQSFSYPLAGEIAIESDLATHLRIPSDWGLELGLLAELYRNSAYRRICEIDLGVYDHRHKEISPDGLLKTAEDSFITLLRTLTETENIVVSEPFLISLQVAYRRLAQDKVRQYHAEAKCNNLSYDRHNEEAAVDLLSRTILTAGRKYLENPMRSQLPDWLRAISAMPNLRERLKKEAIED